MIGSRRPPSAPKTPPTEQPAAVGYASAEELSAEGWEAAVLKLEERLKMARTDITAGPAPTRSPET